jgi:hypothetical protein
VGGAALAAPDARLEVYGKRGMSLVAGLIVTAQRTQPTTLAATAPQGPVALQVGEAQAGGLSHDFEACRTCSGRS